MDREWKQVHRINAQCRELREGREVLLAAAKKRKRDSTVVESTIVRKLVQRCHQCSLCSVFVSIRMNGIVDLSMEMIVFNSIMHI